MNGDFSGSQLVFVSGISADPGGSQLFLLLGIRDPSAILFLVVLTQDPFGLAQALIAGQQF